MQDGFIGNIMGNNIEDKVADITGSAMRPHGYYRKKARRLYWAPDARAFAFATEQPEDVDTNEILFRPTSQSLSATPGKELT